MDLKIFREAKPERRRELQERLTAALPEWFGVPEANRHYAEQAAALPGFVAEVDGRSAGLLLFKRHSMESAEIYWMGVARAHHRHGVGSALVHALCQSIGSDGVKFLFVATLHPSVAYEPYQRTRSFYETLGFVYALAEHGALPDTNPIAYYLKVLEPS